MSLVTIPTMRKPAGIRALVQFVFAGESSLDRRITFSRSSNATVTNSLGAIAYAPHNLLTYSEQFDNTVWAKTGATISTNSIASPNGTTTGDFFVEDTGLSEHRLRLTSISKLPSQDMTFSVYVKPNGRFFTLSIEASGNGLYTNFDVLNNTYNDISFAAGWTRKTTVITNVGNGWYRCSISGTTDTSTSVNVRISLANTFDFTANQTYTGNGTSGIYVWGAQLEIGSTATTYNPTTVKNLLGYTEAFDNAAWTKSNSFVQSNLLTYSEAFDNAAWVKTTITATANSIIAPNGYQTADTLTATGANSTALQTFTASAVPYTYSVYLYRKTGTGNIDITVDGTTWVTKTITVGWTRVDTTLTPAAGSKTAGIRIATNGDEIYAWGAQLVQGSVAGDYRRTDSASLPVFYPNHNGVVCAEKFVENTTANPHYTFGNTYSFLVGTPYTFSFYAKAGERTIAQVVPPGAFGTTYANFNLSNGTLGSVGSGTSASIISVGNGWYRCSVTNTCTVALTQAHTIGTVTLSSSARLESYTGDGTSGIYIFGAQLSDSASLDPYVLNAAAAPSAQAYYGARFDYDPVTLSPKGLLIEEQRINILLNSVMAGGGSAPTSFTQPTGTGTSTPVTSTRSTIGVAYSQSATAQRPYLSQNVTLAASTTYTVSMVIESTSGLANNVILGTSDFAITQYYSNGVAVSASAASVPGILSAVFTNNLGAGAYSIRFGIGIVTTATGTLQFSCPQVEAGAFATSYIPTAASSVTRAADVVVVQGNNFANFWNLNEGTVYCNYANIQTNSFAFDITNGTVNNRVYLRYLGTPLQSQIFYVDATVTQAQIYDATGSNLNSAKTATAYKVNDFSVRTNGGASAGANSTDSSGTVPSVTQMTIGATVSNTGQINGTIKQISYYNTRLQNSQLQALTA